MEKKRIFIIFAGFIVLSIFFLLDNKDGAFKYRTVQRDIQTLSQNGATFNEISDYFKNLAEKGGAAYALTALAQASLPLNTDLHLLGHVVGDELYKQRGLEGIEICTHNFRNACSHAIVIGTLFERGEQSLSDISDVCRTAPGGSGAYTMCFHGLGHGILAYTDYELEDAVPLCKKTGTEVYNNREYVECVGGTIMEMIGGVHDRRTWEKKVEKYFKEEDPLYPCNAPFIPKEVQPICYIYITPHLFETVGGNLGHPTPDDFTRAFVFCNTIPKEQQLNRDACFGGFGKEFTVLANNRDIRNIEQMNIKQLELVHKWCTLAGHEEGENACIDSAVKSLYWGGENNPSVSIKFCDNINKQKQQSFCFEQLFKEVQFYISDYAYREQFCNKIPLAHNNMCAQILLKI